MAASIEFAICNIRNKSNDKITKKKYQLQVITNERHMNAGTDCASLDNIHVTCNKPNNVVHSNASQQTECLHYSVVNHRSQQTIDLSHNINEFIENIIIENEFTDDDYIENITIEYLIANLIVLSSLIVESLIYWRDPKKSGAVFGSILVILLSLAYFSLISVTAYISLIALVGTICFRIYKNIMQAVQKTSDGHPFKEFLELDLTLPQDKVKEVTELVVAHINGGVNELRRLFLVEDLIDSIKFGVLLWCLTYLGAWFNGMTLIIIGFIALFTLPKVYETNKTQIDANLDIVRTKLAEITSKVKAAVPIGKKSEEKKEQ